MQRSSYKEGQPAAAAAAATIAGPQQQTKGHICSSTLHCKLKVVVLLKGNAQKFGEKKKKDKKQSWAHNKFFATTTATV